MRALRRRLARLGVPILDIRLPSIVPGARRRQALLPRGTRLCYLSSFMRIHSKALLAPRSALLLSACGGGGGPAAPTAVPTHPVTVRIYYDQNANGIYEPALDIVRIPNASVSIGGSTARTDSTGKAV